MIPHPLLIILLSPLVSALLVMLTPRRRLLAIRLISALGTAVCLVVSFWVAFHFDKARALDGGGPVQFVEHFDWLPQVGISFFLGVDGVNLSLVLLTAIVIFCGVFASWTVTYRTKEFYCLLLLLVTGVFGVFVSLISCYKGYRAEGGARGVGAATTQAVVLGSLGIMIIDYFLTVLMF